MLDETLITSGHEQSLNALLESEPSQTNIKKIWLVGRFSQEKDRARVIACLNACKAAWVDSCEESGGGHFNELGVFVPSLSLLSFAEQKIKESDAWLMIWPWYCSLPAIAERDILVDLDKAGRAKVCETLLREPAKHGSAAAESGFGWSGKILLALRGGDHKNLSFLIDESSIGNRAGWSLNMHSESNSNSYPEINKSSADKKDTPEFHFGICLRSRQCTNDWPLICRNLERTLFNLSRQRCRHFKVWIAIHEQPDINTYGLDIEFVVMDFKPPVKDDGSFGNDKGRKRKAIGKALDGHVDSGFYYMQLDADDLIDTSLVQAVYDDDNRAGYLIENGYIFDYDNNVAARCNRESLPFWKQCGSCAVLYLEPKDLKSNGDGESYFELQHRHTFFAETAKVHGRELTHWVDDMALYLVNHGENHWSSYRHGSDARRGNSKTRFVHRNAIQSEADMHVLFLRYPELAVKNIKMFKKGANQ